MSSATTGEKVKRKAAMGPEPRRPAPATLHKKKHRSHNNCSKQISNLKKENIATRAALKLTLTKCTTIFRTLLEAQKNATKAGPSVWVDVTHLYSISYGSSQNCNSQYASQQPSHTSQPRIYQESAPAATLNTVEMENVIKELEGIGLVLEGTDLEAEAAGRRQLDSSSSQTSLESEPIGRKSKRFWKPKIVEEIWIVSSSDEDDAENAKPSETSKNATNGKKSILKPNNSQASQVMGKVKKPSALQPSQVQVKPESLEPLDLSQCPTQNCSQLAAANVASKIPASNQAGNSKNVGRQPCRKPCSKCGKLLNAKHLSRHKALKHDFNCKKAGCFKIFISAKDLRDHQSSHGISGIKEHFPKV